MTSTLFVCIKKKKKNARDKIYSIINYYISYTEDF